MTRLTVARKEAVTPSEIGIRAARARRVAAGCALLLAAGGLACGTEDARRAPVDGPAAAESEAAEGEATLSVLTLNIWHDQEDWPARRQPILGGIRALDPDVVGLQEVLQDEGLPNQAETIAESLGYTVHFTSWDPPEEVRRYGNAILVRHQVLVSGWRALEPADDYRNVAHVRIQVAGIPVDLYDTHLHHTVEGGEIRSAQLRGLLAFVEETRGDGPVVLMGDFNAEVDWPEMAPILERYRDALAVLEPELADTVTTLNPSLGHAPRRIDHVFFGPGEAGELRPISAEVVLDEPSEEGVWPSDHFGVLATFAVSPEAP